MAEQASTTLDVVPVEDRNLRGLQIARDVFSVDDRRELAALLTVPAESPALLAFLALCVSEGFSPWANHVWLIPKKIKVPSADGNGEREETKHVPMVGRDGLLHKFHEARATGRARRLDYGVVCEHDTFEARFVKRGPLGYWEVLHEQAPKPAVQHEGAPAISKWRGRVIGAWALLSLAGGEEHYFYAPLEEYARLRHVWLWNGARQRKLPIYHDPREPGKVTFEELIDGVRTRPVQEYEGAWDYKSGMCLKAAQSYVCRIGLGVTGFVPADELRDVGAWQDQPERGAGETAAAFEGFDWGTIANVVIRAELQDAVDEMNALRPNSWSPARCEMRFRERSDYELRKVIEDIRREVEAVRAVDVEPEPPEAVVVEEPEEGERERRQERVEVLGHRKLDLEAALDGASDDEKAQINAELDRIDAELRDLGAES
jgi:hypothetical protein